MSYVKLTARPGGWFKPGTEVFDYDCNPPEDVRRLTRTEWEACNGFVVCVRGLRVVETDYEETLFGTAGTERWDGEACGCSEFDVEFVEESRP